MGQNHCLTLSRVRVSHSSFSLKIHFKNTPCVCLSAHLCLAALGGSAEQAVLKTDQGCMRVWGAGVRVDQRGLSPELLEMVCFFNKAVFTLVYIYILYENSLSFTCMIYSLLCVL